MKCAVCEKSFDPGWSDEEAKAESKEIFGLEVTPETHAVICDDCWKKHPELRGEA